MTEAAPAPANQGPTTDPEQERLLGAARHTLARVALGDPPAGWLDTPGLGEFQARESLRTLPGRLVGAIGAIATSFRLPQDTERQPPTPADAAVARAWLKFARTMPSKSDLPPTRLPGRPLVPPPAAIRAIFATGSVRTSPGVSYAAQPLIERTATQFFEAMGDGDYDRARELNATYRAIRHTIDQQAAPPSDQKASKRQQLADALRGRTPEHNDEAPPGRIHRGLSTVATLSRKVQGRLIATGNAAAYRDANALGRRMLSVRTHAPQMAERYVDRHYRDASPTVRTLMRGRAYVQVAGTLVNHTYRFAHQHGAAFSQALISRSDMTTTARAITDPMLRTGASAAGTLAHTFWHGERATSIRARLRRNEADAAPVNQAMVTNLHVRSILEHGLPFTGLHARHHTRQHIDRAARQAQRFATGLRRSDPQTYTAIALALANVRPGRWRQQPTIPGVLQSVMLADRQFPMTSPQHVERTVQLLSAHAREAGWHALIAPYDVWKDEPAVAVANQTMTMLQSGSSRSVIAGVVGNGLLGSADARAQAALRTINPLELAAAEAELQRRSRAVSAQFTEITEGNPGEYPALTSVASDTAALTIGSAIGEAIVLTEYQRQQQAGGQAGPISPDSISGAVKLVMDALARPSRPISVMDGQAAAASGVHAATSGGRQPSSTGASLFGGATPNAGATGTNPYITIPLSPPGEDDIARPPQPVPARTTTRDLGSPIAVQPARAGTPRPPAPADNAFVDGQPPNDVAGQQWQAPAAMGMPVGGSSGPVPTGFIAMPQTLATSSPAPAHGAPTAPQVAWTAATQNSPSAADIAADIGSLWHGGPGSAAATSSAPDAARMRAARIAAIALSSDATLTNLAVDGMYLTAGGRHYSLHQAVEAVMAGVISAHPRISDEVLHEAMAHVLHTYAGFSATYDELLAGTGHAGQPATVSASVLRTTHIAIPKPGTPEAAPPLASAPKTRPLDHTDEEEEPERSAGKAADERIARGKSTFIRFPGWTQTDGSDIGPVAFASIAPTYPPTVSGYIPPTVATPQTQYAGGGSGWQLSAASPPAQSTGAQPIRSRTHASLPPLRPQVQPGWQHARRQRAMSASQYTEALLGELAVRDSELARMIRELSGRHGYALVDFATRGIMSTGVNISAAGASDILLPQLAGMVRDAYYGTAGTSSASATPGKRDWINDEERGPYEPSDPGASWAQWSGPQQRRPDASYNGQPIPTDLWLRPRGRRFAERRRGEIGRAA